MYHNIVAGLDIGNSFIHPGGDQVSHRVFQPRPQPSVGHHPREFRESAPPPQVLHLPPGAVCPGLEDHVRPHQLQVQLLSQLQQ